MGRLQELVTEYGGLKFYRNSPRKTPPDHFGKFHPFIRRNIYETRTALEMHMKLPKILLKTENAFFFLFVAIKIWQFSPLCYDRWTLIVVGKKNHITAAALIILLLWIDYFTDAEYRIMSLMVVLLFTVSETSTESRADSLFFASLLLRANFQLSIHLMSDIVERMQIRRRGTWIIT